MCFRERIPTEHIFPPISEVLFFRDRYGIIRVETFTEPGSKTKPSEDTLLVKPLRIAIFDGQTSLNGNKTHKGKTGGAIASALARDTLGSLTLPLRNQTIQANRLLHQHMAGAGIDMSDPLACWSTSVAAVDIDELLNCVTIGDSSIVANYRSDETALVIPYIEHDQPTLKAMMKVIRNFHALGKPINPETLLAQPEIKCLIEEVRRNTNKNHGFLNGDAGAEKYVHECWLPRDQISKLLMFSDGYFLPREDPTKQPNWEEMMKIYQLRGLLGLRYHIREMEFSDPNCITFPRFKKHDDGTIISVEFYTEEEYQQMRIRRK